MNVKNEINRRLVLVAACLALAGARGFASEPAAPPSPAEPGVKAAGANMFVGHFGEMVQVPDFWAVDAKMQGPVEVLYFHHTKVDPMRDFSADFKPKAEEYVPENFARLRLMQLMVIPKDVPGGFRTLDELREAKEKELRSTGSPYELMRLSPYPWPTGSFWVEIHAPHRLFQIYSQNGNNFFIFTSGASAFDEKTDDPILGYATEKLTGSLSTYLYDYAFEARLRAPKDKLANHPIILAPGAVVCMLGLLLGVLPKRDWLGRLRLMGRAMFGLTAVSLLLAAPLLFASLRLGFDRTINEASILFFAGIAMPWICRFLSGRMGGRNPWHVFIGTAIANILFIVVGYAVMKDFMTGAASFTGYRNFWMLSLTLSALGFLDGIAFGAAHRGDSRS